MPATNPVIDNIRSRRSIRKYLQTPVPDAVINELLQAAVYAPSAMDAQGWRFIVVKNPAKIKELSDHVKRLFPPEMLSSPGRIARVKSAEDTFFYKAPLLILVTANKAANPWVVVDVGILAQTMFLAAKSLGLGSCFIGLALPLNNDKALLKQLGVPEGHEIVAPLIFGYPAEDKPVPERTFEDKVLKTFE